MTDLSGGAGSAACSSFASMLHQGQSPANSEGGILGLPPPPPAPPSSASPPIATGPTASSGNSRMSKRSYFSAGSDGIIGSGGSRGSLSLSGGSSSNNSGRASLGLGSGSGSDSGPFSRYGNNSKLELDRDAEDDEVIREEEEDTVLGAADAVLATSPIGIAASKVELSSYFAAEARQQEQHGQKKDGTAMMRTKIHVGSGLEGLSLNEMDTTRTVIPAVPLQLAAMAAVNAAP